MCPRVLRENPRETMFPRGISPLGTSADMPFPYARVKGNFPRGVSFVGSKQSAVHTMNKQYTFKFKFLNSNANLNIA